MKITFVTAALLQVNALESTDKFDTTVARSVWASTAPQFKSFADV